MEWYIPITILPGVGLLIMSTTNQMLSLSGEINDLLSVECSTFQHQIADKKILQLTRLTRAATFLYLSAACFVLSGIIGAPGFDKLSGNFPDIVLAMGVSLVFASLAFLIKYGFKTISIRKEQHIKNREGHRTKTTN